MSYFRLSFAKKKVVINKAKFWAILSILLLFISADIWWFLPMSFDPQRWSKVTMFGFVLSLPVLILLLWIIYKIDDWLEKKIDAKIDIYIKNWKSAEKGDKGEELVYKELKRLLNTEDFCIYRNLSLPNMTSDLDIVVVGLKGVILFEVKNMDTMDSYTANQSFYKSRNNRLIRKYSDLREVVSWRAKQLEKHLAESGVGNTRVRKVILYVNPRSVEIKEYGGDSHVYIIQGLDSLQNYLSTVKPDRNFSLDQFVKVSSILAKLG